MPWDLSPLGVYLPRLHLGQVWRHCRAETLTAAAASPFCMWFPIPNPKHVPSTGIGAAQREACQSLGAEGSPVFEDTGNYPRHWEALQ